MGSIVTHQNINFSLAYYSGDRKTGTITLVERIDGETTHMNIELMPESADRDKPKAIFVGLTSDKNVVLLDPETKELLFKSHFPADAFAAHKYSDSNSNRDWFMNDGDKATGNDTLNCGNNGSSVTVIENTDTNEAKYLKTICVGRGHHQANFSFPSVEHPDTPKQTYISNLKDGTVSVIDNDPDHTETYLSVIETIVLFESEKEESSDTVPNNSFPHGLVFSSVSGKVYNLNNGYGTIAIINPKSHQIEQRIGFKGHSNLFMSPCGHYVIGRGADRKSDANHVVAKLTVLDVTTNEIVDSVDIPDIYISKYFFNPEGSRLYLTTSSSGSDEQKANLKTDALLVYDMSALPKIKLINEVRLGSSSGTLDFSQQNNETQLMFSSNAAEGVIAVMDKDGNLLEKITVGESMAHSRLWTIN